MPALKNPRHESFCQHRAAGKTCDESYRLAGYKPDRHHAARLATYGHIEKRLKELQQKTAEAYEVTAESIARELDGAIVLARKCKQTSAMVAAITSKAKLFGLMTDRSVINVTNKYTLMSEEELRFEIAALNAEARAIKPGVQH